MDSRITVGRFLQAIHVGKGKISESIAFAESQGHWLDRAQVVGTLKTGVPGLGTGGYDSLYNPVGEAFLAAMRQFSVPMRLTNLRRVPMLTRVYVNTGAVVAAPVAEGAPIPVLRGTWDATTLTPRKHGGVIVQTDELLTNSSPVAAVALVDDLAAATAEEENRSFVDPTVSGSVLYGAANFNASGSGLSDIDTDLKRLIGLVPGAYRPGAAFVMCMESATHLGALRGSGGSAAYPNIGPQGGSLMGLPVLVTSACADEGSPVSRKIGLIYPGDIFWADEGKVELSVSNQAALQMLDNPTNSAATPTPTDMVSMFQTHSTAIKAIKESSWYSRSGAGAYFVSGY